jgi:YbbR domain-containing protein
MEITGESNTEVSLQLRGSSNLLNEMSPADVTAVISLSRQNAGLKSLPLTPDNIQTPFGVEVLRIDPPRVEFRLERTLTRPVRVEATIEGTPAEDFVVGPTVINPPTVTVRGPESRVDSLESLATVPISIEGARSDVTRSVDLDVKDPLVRLESLSPHEITVQIREFQDEDTFRIAIDPAMESTGRIVDPGQIVAEIRGPRSLVRALDPQSLVFTVDTDGLEPGRHQLQPYIPNLDPALMITAIVPTTVDVEIGPGQ